MSTQATIRIAGHEDYTELGEVMYDAVRHGCPVYTAAQLEAWVSAPPSGSTWNQRLHGQAVFVAETTGGLLGFLSLAEDGLIDLAFIRPAAQGTGLFRRLFQALEQFALERGLTRLKVLASLAAEPAFTAVGFTIAQRESVQVGGQSLSRYVMYKDLSKAD